MQRIGSGMTSMLFHNHAYFIIPAPAFAGINSSRSTNRRESSNIDSGFPFILLGLLVRLAGASESAGADTGMTKKYLE